MAARRLGSGCAAPPAQAARVRPLPRAPKEVPLLCAEGRGCSLGEGFVVHVRELIGGHISTQCQKPSPFGCVQIRGKVLSVVEIAPPMQDALIDGML